MCNPQGAPLGMNRLCPQNINSEVSNRLAAAHFLFLRHEENEEEDEGHGKQKEDDDDDDDTDDVLRVTSRVVCHLACMSYSRVLAQSLR